MTKMRDYVDGIQGAGTWDRMHDLINQQQLFGWTMPPVEVDGRKVSIVPGDDREVTLEAVQDEIRKCFKARLGPLRPTGTADLYGVPRAEE